MNAMIAYRKLCEMLSPVTDSPSFESMELLRRFGNIPKERLLAGEGVLAPAEEVSLFEAARRRLGGYPLQYLIGEWDFYGRTYSVGEGVLIPRADTETLVEAALSWSAGRKGIVIADLCSGSGCIAVTLSKELPDSKVYALENSAEAFYYLERNIQKLEAGVTACFDDVLSPGGEYSQFDLIVSNPPYLTGEDMASLQTEVKAEPRAALFGGEDGLTFYREIPIRWRERLKPGGAIFFEVGAGQADSVEQILKNNRFINICTRKDICGIIRVVGGELPQE